MLFVAIGYFGNRKLLQLLHLEGELVGVGITQYLVILVDIASISLALIDVLQISYPVITRVTVFRWCSRIVMGPHISVIPNVSFSWFAAAHPIKNIILRSLIDKNYFVILST